MIDHVSIGVKDLKRASAFYEAVLGQIGLQKLVNEPATVGFGKKYPEFWLNHRPERTFDSGTGSHVCLRTRNVESVNAFYDAAIEMGAAGDGEPGFRPEYHDSYYAAFIVDSDGNRIEVVTFVTT